MNILPLIFAFLLIFSCLAFGFFKEVQSFSLTESTLRSYRRTERAVDNAIAQKAYRKIPTEKAQGKKESEPKKAEDYRSRRISTPPSDSAKFNIAPLIKHEGDIKLHPLYEALAEYLRLLYQGNAFAGEAESIEYKLIDEMVRQAKKLSSQELFQLYPKDPALQKIFYKILQGTNQYAHGVGITPLRDALCIQKEAPAISFSFASPVLLEALLGEKGAAAVLEGEKQKWAETGKYYYYGKNDLQPLFLTQPALAMTLTALDPYLDFSKKMPPKQLVSGKDKKTGMSIEKQI